MSQQREFPLYTLARNLASGRKELKSTTEFDQQVFAEKLKEHGYADSIVFTEIDYRRAATKRDIYGDNALTSKERHIVQTYTDIQNGKYGNPPEGVKQNA